MDRRRPPALVVWRGRTSVGKLDKKVIRRSYAEGELEVTTL